MMARPPPPERPSSSVVRLSRNTGNLFLKLAVASRRGNYKALRRLLLLPLPASPPTRAFPSNDAAHHTCIPSYFVLKALHAHRARARA